MPVVRARVHARRAVRRILVPPFGSLSAFRVRQFIVCRPQNKCPVAVPCRLVGRVVSLRIFVPVQGCDSKLAAQAIAPLSDSLSSRVLPARTKTIKKPAKPSIAWLIWPYNRHRNVVVFTGLLHNRFPVAGVVPGERTNVDVETHVSAKNCEALLTNH